VQSSAIQNLVTYGGTGYHRRRCETELNALPQFTTEIDGLDLVNRLGYARYVAQDGDIGAAVTDAMAIQALDGLAGIHLNFLRRPPLEVAAALLGRAPAPLRLEEPAVSRPPIRTDQGDQHVCHDRKSGGRHSNPAIHDPEDP
jgi:hypothetical protein